MTCERPLCRVLVEMGLGRKVVRNGNGGGQEAVCCCWVLIAVVLLMSLAMLQFQGVDAGGFGEVKEVTVEIRGTQVKLFKGCGEKEDGIRTHGEKGVYYSELIDYGGAFHLRYVEEWELETREMLEIIDKECENHKQDGLFLFDNRRVFRVHAELWKVLVIRKPSQDGPEIIFRRVQLSAFDPFRLNQRLLVPTTKEHLDNWKGHVEVELAKIEKAVEERDEALNKYQDKLYEGGDPGDVWKHQGKCAQAKERFPIKKETRAYITLIKFYYPERGDIPGPHAIVSIQLSSNERKQYDINTLHHLPPDAKNAKSKKDELKNEKEKAGVVCLTCIQHLTGSIFMFNHLGGDYCEVWKVASVDESSRIRADYHEVFIYVALQLKWKYVRNELRRKTPFLYMEFPETTLRELQKGIKG